MHWVTLKGQIQQTAKNKKINKTKPGGKLGRRIVTKVEGGKVLMGKN